MPISLAAAADWPQFLGPNRDGTSGEPNPHAAWPAGGPTRVWEYALGTGWSGPVVVGGTVFVFHRVGDDDVLDSLDATTGARRWRWARPANYRDQFGFDNGPRATPTVAAGRV